MTSVFELLYPLEGTSVWIHRGQIYGDVVFLHHLHHAIDLANGLKTNATLTYPAVGKRPFPRVLLIQGAGVDRPSPEIAHLSERGFAVADIVISIVPSASNTLPLLSIVPP